MLELSCRFWKARHAMMGTQHVLHSISSTTYTWRWNWRAQFRLRRKGEMGSHSSCTSNILGITHVLGTSTIASTGVLQPSTSSTRHCSSQSFVCIRVMHGYPIRRSPVPVPETADHGAGTGREMRGRVRVRIVNFHVLTRPRVFAQRLPYSAQYVDGVVGTLKGTHNLYQQKALALGIKYGGYGYGYPYKLGLYHGSGRVRKSLPVHDSGLHSIVFCSLEFRLFVLLKATH
jgi:hypothetical protein